jgi:hypothetical protein
VRLLSSLFSKTQRNYDPYQEALASMILDGANHLATEGEHGTPVEVRGLRDLQRAMNWSDEEMQKRVVHAAAIIKERADHETYVCAKVIAERLYAWCAHSRALCP